MAVTNIPEWIEELDDEDLSFIKRFVIGSGSLKELSREYGVSYPTVRLRLDRIIDKIKMQDDRSQDPFVRLIKKLALDDRIDFETAKLLINAYNQGEKK